MKWEPTYKLGQSVEYLDLGDPAAKWSKGWVITLIDMSDQTYSIVHRDLDKYTDYVQEIDIRPEQDTVTVSRSLLVECEDMVKLAYDSANTAFRAAVTPEQVVYAFELHDRIMTVESRIRDTLTRGDTR